MSEVLKYLLEMPVGYVLLIFLIENMMITAGVLLIGRLFSKSPYSAKEWWLCGVTNLLNTGITYAGFGLWKHHFIMLDIHFSWMILVDFVFLFLSMDFLMFVFHIIIHKTFLFKAVHQLHHEAVDPKPIDLFVLHPIETIGFGSLWLLLLVIHPFNSYAIIIYLIVNVIFGMTGHLGMEPLPEKMMRFPLIKYLGTSTFHHNHHKDVQYNFGFYTSIWDRLFKTYK